MRLFDYYPISSAGVLLLIETLDEWRKFDMKELMWHDLCEMGVDRPHSHIIMCYDMLHAVFLHFLLAERKMTLNPDCRKDNLKEMEYGFTNKIIIKENSRVKGINFYSQS